MEDLYVFSERQRDQVLDTTRIMNIIQRASSRNPSIKEGNTITLLIMGHGRERYKENFRRNLRQNPDYYSEPFKYVVDKQTTKNTVRILSKAGKPKVCAWDYSLCSPSMSSQDIIIELSKHFFNPKTNPETTTTSTFALMNALSIYFKTVYPRIIEKISQNYQDLPEDKHPGSPGAEGYEERFEQFSRVLQSLEENKFSELKALNHEKVFTIRPDNAAGYEDHCERYHFEIIDARIEYDISKFLEDNFDIGKNLVSNYYSMSRDDLEEYISSFNKKMNEIYYSLQISDYDKFYIIKFIYNLYFGKELLLSEIIEFFTIMGIETINIIDNTCRVKDITEPRQSIPTPETGQIEEEEQIRNLITKSKSKTPKSSAKTMSSKGGSSQTKKTKKTKKRKLKQM
jgi:hypothetical protein